MAKDTEIDKQIKVVDGDMTQEEAFSTEPAYERMFQVYPNTRIPVSKSTGKFWEMRQQEAYDILRTKGYLDRWKEVVAYYQNDQGGKSGKRQRLGEASTGESKEMMYTTENIVFANVSALIPAVYAKNPDIEITSVKAGQDGEKKAKLYEELCDALINRKVNPGINMKPKMRRAALTTVLTNISYFMLSYVKKEDSSEAAFEEISSIADQLKDAKDTKEIASLEGQLMALEEKITILNNSGPKLTTIQPKYVLRDPLAIEPDLSDANYMIIGEMLRTSYLRAVYASSDAKDADGKWKSLYEPTHIMMGEAGKSDIAGHDEEINNFSLLSGSEEEYKKYGYTNEEAFKENCCTLVWTVWDKTTRRVLMFHDKDWSWPIWVWDDPYKLTRFFPIFPLTFYTDPEDIYAKSEVMYYLDQQDEINRVNNERSRMRHWASTKIFADKSVFKSANAVEKFLNAKSTNKMVHGIDLPDGKKITDAIGTIPLPSTQFETLFDTKPLLESINRMSSVTPVLQAQQYKTNTTNKAIESYESTTQTRLDEKIDAIEDVMGDIAMAMLEMCVQNMSEEQVKQLVGEDRVVELGGWQNMDNPMMLYTEYNFQIVGGSTLKPTSKVKKELAMNLAQILGQFASVSPMVVIVMLKMIERAFGEDVVITKDEWDQIVGSVQGAAQQQAQSQGQQQGGAQPGSSNDLSAALEQVSQLFDSMPPEMKQEVGKAVAHGVPLKEIASKLVDVMNQSKQAQPQQSPQQPAQPQQPQTVQ